MKLLIRWVIVSLALFVAAWAVPGITVEGNAWIAYAVMAVVLGLVNAIVRPLLKLLTCPLIILTLGVFVLVVNALTLWVSAQITTWLSTQIDALAGIRFVVTDFWSALLGALIVSVVTVVLSALVKDESE